jgi:pimeloyl-ACP methyl ester carboxylesterase
VPLVEIGGRRLFYADRGAGDAAVLFLHGFLLDHTLWDDVIAGLDDGVRTLAMDVRGHGMSETDGPATMADLAADAIGVLDAAGVSRAVLVGHSQGGFTALEAALGWPDRVAGLVLVDTAPGPPGAEAEAGLHEMAEVWCSGGPVGPLAQGMADLQVGPGPVATAMVRRWQSRPPAQWRHQWTTVIDGHPGVRERLGEIGCPASVVWGTLDAGFEAAVDEFSAGLPGFVEVVRIEGAYHAPPYTHPGEVAGAVNRLVREARPAEIA